MNNKKRHLYNCLNSAKSRLDVAIRTENTKLMAQLQLEIVYFQKEIANCADL